MKRNKIEDIDDILSSDDENEVISTETKEENTKGSDNLSFNSNEKDKSQTQLLTNPIEDKKNSTKTINILNCNTLLQKKSNKIKKRLPSDSSPRNTIATINTKTSIKTYNHENVFDMNPLHRISELITQWNIFEDIFNGKLNQEDNISPSISPSTSSSCLNTSLIPRIFKSCAEYYKTWEPLLVDEIKANTCANISINTKNSAKAGILNIGVGAIADFRSSLIKLHCSYDDTSHSSNQIESLQNMDLILLSLKPFQLPLIESNIRLQSQSELKCTMLAIVTSTTSGSRDRGRDSNSVQILALRKNWEYIRITNVNETTDNTKKKNDAYVRMNYVIIDSLVSRWREFMALSEIVNIQLKDAIVYASVEMNIRPSLPNVKNDIEISSFEIDESKEISGLPKKLRKVLNNKFNSSQLLAIRMACRDQNKITLVQGPPGTGKTTTIIGILNALHVREYNRYYKSCIDELVGPNGMLCRQSKDIKSWTKFISSLSKKKPHILVVAPSNVAVDNIIQRIMEKEFYDGNGSKYKPDMLRIGAGKTASVQAVSLEDKMKQHQLLFLSEMERTKAQNDLVRDISDIIEQIKRIQSYLINLSIAFNLCQLPENWELRVDPATANPYWVDHTMLTSSPNPPLYSSQPKSHYTLELLPEYQLYASEVTNYLEKLNTLNLLLTRSKAKTNPSEFGGYMEARQAVETSIIEEAHLLCTTVNSAGHPSLESTDFEIVVIDEACQCLEPAALIALRRGCKRCIMVGDPQQLPATIFADSNKKSGFEVSLFERLMKAGQHVVLLDQQYRMHPDINNFPSMAFYDSRLCNGMNVQDENYSPPHLKNLFLPFFFFDLQTSREQYQHKSCSNDEEATLCQNILEALMLEARRHNVNLGSVGIISPYSDQINEIKKRLSESGYFDDESRSLFIPSAGYAILYNLIIHYFMIFILYRCHVNRPDIEINTVDGFQGREKDIIIMSCVRSNDTGTIGFLSDRRRMNVAITRAKFGLYIIGNINTLRHNSIWNSLIKSALDRRLLVHIPTSSTLILPILRELYSLRSIYKQSVEISVHAYETDSILYDCKRRRLENEEFINIVLDKETEEGEII